MKRLLLAAALLSTPCFAQDESVQGHPPERIRSILLKPGDKCPKATSEDEVVVCAPIEQPYRLPREFRGPRPGPASNSWVNRAADLAEDGRANAGVPNSCSPVGFAGQGGCLLKLLDRWRAERAAIDKGEDR